MEPRSKGRFTTKASNFSKELYEDLLCEIFSLRDIAGHAQAERVDPTIVPLVKLFEGYHVALRSFLSERVVGFLRGLDFGCGHVFLKRQAMENSHRSARSPEHHESAYFKGVAKPNFALPMGSCEVWRLTRV